MPVDSDVSITRSLSINVSKPRNLKTLKIRELSNEINSRERSIAYRFIAVWILVEAFAGGVMHTFNLPFTGLLINGLALICILFIARYAQPAVSILQATLLVAIFKFLLSPQSPPTAYLAVFFQGLTGQLLFYSGRISRFRSILFGVITLLESGAQRILVLWVFYGNTFWKAFNGFIAKLTQQSPDIAYARWLSMGYLLIHVLAGVVIGNYAYLLVNRSESWRKENSHLLFEQYFENTPFPSSPKKTTLRLGLSWVILLVLIGMMLHDQFDPMHRLIPESKLGSILIRMVLILLGWILIIKPVVSALLNRWLQRQQLKESTRLSQLREQLPAVRWIIEESWRRSAPATGFIRIRLFLKTAIVNLL